MLELGRSAASLNQAGKDALLSRDVGGALRNASPMQHPSHGKVQTQEHAPHRSAVKLPKECPWCKGRVQRRQRRAPTPGDPRKRVPQGRPSSEPMPVVKSCLRLHLRARSLSQARCRSRRGPGHVPEPGQGRPGGSPCEGQTSAGAMEAAIKQCLKTPQRGLPRGRHAELCQLRGCGSPPAAPLQMSLQPPSQRDWGFAQDGSPGPCGVLFLRCPTWKDEAQAQKRWKRQSQRHRPACLDRSLRMSPN